MSGLEEKLERIEQSALYRELSRYNGEVVRRRMEIDLKDYEWLIQQAERVQELEELNRILSSDKSMFIEELVREQHQNKRYREALEGISQKRITYADMAGVLRIAREALEGEG